MPKNALCIGINDYPGTGSDLAGCVNDANDWKAALEQRGFKVRLLLNKEATKQAMQQAIKRLVQAARSGDLLVITYSGHGSWIPDPDQDEPDARDEVLCPYDIAQKRPLTDDELYDLFEERERGVRIVMISDSCHSGSVTRIAPARGGTDTPRVRFLPPEHFLSPAALRKAAGQATPRVSGAPRPFGGVLLSGCQDTEYSYDAVFDQRPNGAFTYFALKTLNDIPADASYRDWFQAIRAELPNQSQPQTPNFGGTPSQMEWQVFETERRLVENDTRGVQAGAGEYLQRGHNTERVTFAQSNRRSTVATTATTANIEQTVRKVLNQVLTEVSDEVTSAHEDQPGSGAPTPPPDGKAARAPSNPPSAAQPVTPQPPEDGAGEGQTAVIEQTVRKILGQALTEVSQEIMTGDGDQTTPEEDFESTKGMALSQEAEPLLDSAELRALLSDPTLEAEAEEGYANEDDMGYEEGLEAMSDVLEEDDAATTTTTDGAQTGQRAGWESEFAEDDQMIIDIGGVIPASSRAMETAQPGQEPSALSAAEASRAKLSHGERAVRAAVKQKGYRENGNNRNKFTEYMYRNKRHAQPWCADFVSWAFDSTGDRNRRVPWGNPSAVASILQWGQKHGRMVDRPRPGDIFVIKTQTASHTGLVRRVGKNSFLSIEGNTTLPNGKEGVWSKWHPINRYRFIRGPR